MNPNSYQFLAEDHVRSMHRRVEAIRPVVLARQASKARKTGRTGSSERPDGTGPRFEIVRRLVARLVAV
jgi:hypothetical protein